MVDIKIIENHKPGTLGSEEDLGFGRVFSDHMFLMDYKDGAWVDPRIVPFGNIELSPAAPVFHYGLEIFEGLKAYRNKDGGVQLFRPELNIKRLNNSAKRLTLPTLDEDEALECLMKFVDHERDWVPSGEGTSLYLRPFMIGTGQSLGVKPGKEALFAIIASPSGAYYGEGGLEPVKIRIEERDVRAFRGGTGESKCGGNYGAQMRASKNALDQGFSEVLWLDGVERKYIEEVGAMNVMFLIGDVVVTPELSGSILPGITRRSIIELLRARGYEVEERKISVDELVGALEDGSLKEAFGTGTAAVVSPIGTLAYKDQSYTVGHGGVGELSKEIYQTLSGIQRGEVEDEFDWIRPV